MRLGKPPLLEAYIRFDVEYRESPPPLDQTRAAQFLQGMGDEFLPKDVVQTESVRIQWDKSGQPKKLGIRRTLEQVRACSPDETRWIQVGAAHLTHNIVGKGYPGYLGLRTAAMKHFDHYLSFFGPSAVKEVSLHYVDMIDIPKRDGMRYEDFFALYPEVPARFNPIAGFLMALTTHPKGNPDDSLQVTFSREPDDLERGLVRMRMEWNASSRNVDTLDKTDMIARLDRLHAEVEANFRDCFTPQGWQLFEPQEG